MHKRREDVGREIMDFGSRITKEATKQGGALMKMGLKEPEAGFLVAQAMVSVLLGILVRVMGKAKLTEESLLGISRKILALVDELPSESNMN